MKGTILLTFDLEEFDLPREYGIKVSDEKEFEPPYRGLMKVLDIIDEFEFKCTFFATNVFADKNPSTIKNLKEKGHEIGSHGLSHAHNYSIMPVEESIEKLKKCRTNLETICDCTVQGFRAPRLRHPALTLLKEVGFLYDSSIHPTYVPGRYNNLERSCDVKEYDGITEIPISVMPFIRLPYSWIWFRNLGVTYAKLATQNTLAFRDFVNIYFHPWEFVDLTKMSIPRIIKRNTGEPMAKSLDEYVRWCLKKDFKFTTISDYLGFKEVE